MIEPSKKMFAFNEEVSRKLQQIKMYSGNGDKESVRKLVRECIDLLKKHESEILSDQFGVKP